MNAGRNLVEHLLEDGRSTFWLSARDEHTQSYIRTCYTHARDEHNESCVLRADALDAINKLIDSGNYQDVPCYYRITDSHSSNSESLSRLFD